jgi:Family of unknown function (DUF5994)
MMSAPNSSTLQNPVTTKLALKPGVEARSPATGFVDGAWWPGSRDLASEVRALIESLPEALGRVERVSYNLATWGVTARILHIDGAAVHLAGYRSQNADTVDVLGRDHRVTLLVVPPEATEDAAHRALAAAASAGNTDSPAELLATSGARPGVPVSAH